MSAKTRQMPPAPNESHNNPKKASKREHASDKKLQNCQIPIKVDTESLEGKLANPWFKSGELKNNIFKGHFTFLILKTMLTMKNCDSKKEFPEKVAKKLFFQAEIFISKTLDTMGQVFLFGILIFESFFDQGIYFVFPSN